MRKQLITAAAGGKKEGRNKEDGRGERGRSIGIAPNADGCGVFTFRGRQQTERGRERYIRTGWGNKNVRTQEGSKVKHQMVQSVC